MAKIVTITNPLTGQPAQVDQLDHTAQQIDDGLNIARGVSNPNLLDNWYFGNPINQRGQTSYTGAQYGIDRWKGYDGTTVLIVSGGLKLAESADNSNDAFITQFLPNFADFAGKTLTFSVLVLSSTGPGVRIRISDGVSSTTGDYCTSGVCTVTHTFNSNPTDLQVTIRGVTKQAYETVLLAAKLELGTTQTLAHQENGNWVLNEIPDYGEQLARCMRYYQTGEGVYVLSNANSDYTSVFGIKGIMRAIPSISIKNNALYDVTGTVSMQIEAIYVAMADRLPAVHCASNYQILFGEFTASADL